MSHETIATILWTMLAIALVLTGIGFARRSFWIMLIAAHITFLFGVAAILSIGIFIIPISVLQFIAAFAFFRRSQRDSIG
jgi:hypothetical protein